jgi:hypothetical protein
MKIIEHIKSESIKYLVSALFGLLILLIGLIYQDALLVIYPEVIQKLPKEVFLKITTLAILLFFLSSILALYFYLQYKNKLVPKFGIYWSKDKEPHCPACKGLMSREMPMKYNNTEYTAFVCLKCYPSPKITDFVGLNHNGSFITRSEAIKLLR